jgi:hypothetical protein
MSIADLCLLTSSGKRMFLQLLHTLFPHNKYNCINKIQAYRQTNRQTTISDSPILQSCGAGSILQSNTLGGFINVCDCMMPLTIEDERNNTKALELKG